MKRAPLKCVSHQEKLCANCGSSSFSIKALGYCSRCYPIFVRLKHTKQWDSSRKGTLLHYPKLANYPLHHWTHDFPEIKKYTIRELRKRLLHFKQVENDLSGKINGYDIEVKLRYLAIRAGAGRDSLSKCAGTLDSQFTLRQRKILFKLLTELTENIKWCGITLRGFKWYSGMPLA